MKNSADIEDDYLEDLTFFSRISLSTFGASPTQKNERISRGLFSISLFCVLFGVVIPQLCRLFQVWQDLDRLSNVLCTAELPFLVATTKMIMLYRNKQKMTTLYDYMMADWKRKKSNEELDIMIENGRKGKIFSLICIISGHMTVTSRVFQWIFENISNWSTPAYYKNYTLLIDAYFPFTWNYSPVIGFLCSFEYVGTVCATLAYSGSDAYFSQISTHYTAQYHILRLKLMDFLNNFNNIKCESEFNKEFGNIITTQYHINSCIEIIESNFYLMFLAQLLASTLQFCLLGYFLVLYLKHPNISLLPDILFIVVFCIYQIGNFYIFCYLTEILQVESYEFADTAYESKWYNIPPRKAKLIILLIQSGNKPVEITAGKFFVFNFKLFGSIIKTSLGYLSFLITMKKSH